MRYEFRTNELQKPGLLGRILIGLATVGLVIVGFFFITAALIAGALIALVIGVRLWWTLRKLKRAQADGIFTASRGGREGALDGEYQVVERESSEERLPKASGSKPPNNTPPER